MLNPNTVDSFMKNPHGSQNSIYPNLINELPAYLMQPMTRFALCFPEFVQLALQPTATVVALKKELCLWAVRIWYDSVSIHFDKMCSPMYVFQTSWDVSTQELPSIFIFFYQNKWAIWAGEVHRLPGFAWHKTHEIVVCDVKNSLNDIKHKCANLVQSLTTKVSDQHPQHTINHNKFLQQWFPGLCKNLQSLIRPRRLASLKRVINHLSSNLNLSEKMQVIYRLTADESVKLKRIENFQVIGQLLSYNHGIALLSEAKDSGKILGDSSEKYDIKTSFFINLISNIVKSNRLSGKHDISVCIHDALYQVFKQELLYFFEDSKCHPILCSRCQEKWFYSYKDSIDCTAHFCPGLMKGSQAHVIPLEIWPIHIVTRSIDILENFEKDTFYKIGTLQSSFNLEMYEENLYV